MSEHGNPWPGMITRQEGETTEQTMLRNQDEIIAALRRELGEVREQLEIERRLNREAHERFLRDREVLYRAERELDAARAEVETLKGRLKELEFPRIYLPPGEERRDALLVLALKERDALKAEVERLREIIRRTALAAVKGGDRG